MAETFHPRAVRRIVTAIPAATEVTPVLRLAARMAGWCDASVAAVLVQNEALLRLASLPVTRHLLSATGAAEPLTPQTLRLALAAYSQRVRADLDAVFGATNIRWTLHTAVDAEEAPMPVRIEPADLLLISGQTRVTEAWFRAEALAEPAIAAFVLGDEAVGARDVMTIHDGTEAGWRAVEAGALLALALGRSCHVVISETATAEERRMLDDKIAQMGVAGQQVAVPALDAGVIGTTIERRNPSLVVMPMAILQQSGLTEVLNRLARRP